MDGKKPLNKSVIAVSLALLLVLVLLIGTFVMSQKRNKQETIVLPTKPTDTEVLPMPEDQMEDTMIQVQPDNVIQVLETVETPRFFHQSFWVSVGSGYPRAVRRVELWKNDTLLHAEITVSGSGSVKSVLTDGATAWIWYDSDFVPASVKLPASASIEDILGLPTFDYLQHLKQSAISQADYEVLQTMQQCIFAATEETAGKTEQYWIDLQTGLLQKAQVLEQGDVAYEVEAEILEVLAPGDSSYEGRFCLPDGSRPFIEESKTLPQ